MWGSLMVVFAAADTFRLELVGAIGDTYLHISLDVNLGCFGLPLGALENRKMGRR
jgi:hypothetical protein